MDLLICWSTRSAASGSRCTRRRWRPDGEQLNTRLDAEANSIAWLVCTTWVQDDHVARRGRDRVGHGARRRSGSGCPTPPRRDRLRPEQRRGRGLLRVERSRVVDYYAGRPPAHLQLPVRGNTAAMRGGRGAGSAGDVLAPGVGCSTTTWSTRARPRSCGGRVLGSADNRGRARRRLGRDRAPGVPRAGRLPVPRRAPRGPRASTSSSRQSNVWGRTWSSSWASTTPTGAVDRWPDCTGRCLTEARGPPPARRC